MKQIPMNLFIMWMAGNSISIFPIMMVGMMFFRPIQAFMAISQSKSLSKSNPLYMHVVNSECLFLVFYFSKERGWVLIVCGALACIGATRTLLHSSSFWYHCWYPPRMHSCRRGWEGKGYYQGNNNTTMSLNYVFSFDFLAFKAIDGTHASLQRAVYTLGNIMSLGLAIYKCQVMGLLPTHPSDWLAFVQPQEVRTTCSNWHNYISCFNMQ